jgi:SSS family solute:Na+ symporter
MIRLSAVLYLASIAIRVLLDLSAGTVINFGGLFVLIYTVIGGTEVVIWTDVVQTIML